MVHSWHILNPQWGFSAVVNGISIIIASVIAINMITSRDRKDLVLLYLRRFCPVSCARHWCAPEAIQFIPTLISPKCPFSAAAGRLDSSQSPAWPFLTHAQQVSLVTSFPVLLYGTVIDPVSLTSSDYVFILAFFSFSFCIFLSPFDWNNFWAMFLFLRSNLWKTTLFFSYLSPILTY